MNFHFLFRSANMSQLVASMSLVPHPVTHFTFRVQGVSAASFTSAVPGSPIQSPSFTAAGRLWRVNIYLGDDKETEPKSCFLGVELFTPAVEAVKVVFSCNASIADAPQRFVSTFSTWRPTPESAALCLVLASRTRPFWRLQRSIFRTVL